MEKAFTVNLVSYVPLLKSAGIKFREDEKTLTVGKPSAAAGFVIHISCRTLDAPQLLSTIIPSIKNSKAAYRIIKGQHDQYRLNAGAYGDDESGKVVSIFPSDLDEAARLSKILLELTQMFKGPVVMNAQRIGVVLYVQKTENSPGGELVLSKPSMKQFPFPVPPQYKDRKNRFGLIGGCYLPTQLMRASSKGNIYKAINLKRFAFDWCLIKQGNPVALDDHFDRDMKDRLVWQKEVAEVLKGKVYTPDVIDFFSKKDYHYLVLNYAEGDSLGMVVREILGGKLWTEISVNGQYKLLNYFLQATEIVKSIHEAEFVHRDITDSNFILLHDGKLCVIDFELSYSLIKRTPDPPFLLGTFGYAAPEQIEHAVPDKKEDVYSLGALLCFILTACKTWEFITSNHHQLKVKLLRMTGERDLTDIILKCLSPRRLNRPDVDEIIAVIRSRINQLNLNIYEKTPLAV